MHRLKVLTQMKRVLIPGPAVTGTVTLLTVGAFGAVKVVSAAKPAPPPEQPKDCDPNKPLVRAKDLPIYYDPEKNVLHKPKTCHEEAYPDNSLMYLVKVSRAGIWNAMKEVEKLKVRAHTFIETGQSHALSSLEQLRESEDPTQRYAVIGAGTFLGFLFGLRGGFFKKLLYTSTGAVASAALVYPEEAEVYWRDVREILQEYYSIAYHFTHAAIKDLTGVEFSVPEFNKLNPVETIKVWIGKSSDGDNVSKSSPTSASLLPPVAETPSHVVPVTPASTKPGSIPLPPLEKPTKSESIEKERLKDQGIPADKDMYSLRS